MKAIICTRYGPPEVLQLQDVPTPEPKDKEVRIQIHATSVTASDVIMRSLNAPIIYKIMMQLMMGFGKPRNPILGMVASGVVERTGKNVTKFKAGDAVFSYGPRSPLKLRFGTYAEYFCLPEDWNLAHKPANLSHEEATAIPYGALLAWWYFKKLDLHAGKKVLIYGASGSIGTMALQFARNAGTTVTAVCSSRNFELVKSLGAVQTIDYTLENAVDQLETYDLVFDAVGNTKTSALKEKSKKALTAKGKYISVDDATPSASREDFLQIKTFAEQGRLKAIIDRSYPLEEMVEAHKYVGQGHKQGNVIIQVIKE